MCLPPFTEPGGQTGRFLQRGSAAAARRAHNPQSTSSNLVSAMTTHTTTTRIGDGKEFPMKGLAVTECHHTGAADNDR